MRQLLVNMPTLRMIPSKECGGGVQEGTGMRDEVGAGNAEMHREAQDEAGM